MLQFRRLGDERRLARHAEDLLKVEALPLVDDVEDLAGMEILLTLQDRGKVGRGVERRAVGFQQDAGRDLLRVGFLLHGHDERAFGLNGQALALDDVQHLRDILLRVGLAEPDVEADVQVFIVALQIHHRDAHDVLPHRAVAPVSRLEQIGRVVRARGERLVRLALCAGRGIDLFQLRDRERRFLRIFTGEVRVEVGELRMTVAHLFDDEAHLQAPVAEVDVADDAVAEVAVDALDGLADDGAAQMADVERLGHVRAAVVEDDGARVCVRLHAEAVARLHLAQELRQILARELQVQKAGVHGLDRFKHLAVRQLFADRRCDLDGRFVIGFGSGHRAVALKFAQVGPVGERRLTKAPVKTGSLERIRDLLGDQIYKNLHRNSPFLLIIESIIAENRTNFKRKTAV